MAQKVRCGVDWLENKRIWDERVLFRHLRSDKFRIRRSGMQCKPHRKNQFETDLVPARERSLHDCLLKRAFTETLIRFNWYNP